MRRCVYEMNLALSPKILIESHASQRQQRAELSPGKTMSTPRNKVSSVLSQPTLQTLTAGQSLFTSELMLKPCAFIKTAQSFTALLPGLLATNHEATS